MEGRSESLGQIVLSVLLSGAAFVGFVVLTNALVPSLAVAVGVFFAGWFLFKPARTLKVKVSGLSLEMVEEALEAGRAQNEEIRRLAARITATTVKADAQGISEVYQNLLDDIRKEPKDLKSARGFLNYYPDAVIRILTRYTELQSKNLRDRGVAESLTKTEQILGSIRRAFEKQLSQLLQDDVMDLDVELELLRRTMASEGLEGSESK